jgi:hypothetical protein
MELVIRPFPLAKEDPLPLRLVISWGEDSLPAHNRDVSPGAEIHPGKLRCLSTSYGS